MTWLHIPDLSWNWDTGAESKKGVLPQTNKCSEGRMTVLKKQLTTNTVKDTGNRELSHSADGTAIDPGTMESIWRFLIRMKIRNIVWCNHTTPVYITEHAQISTPQIPLLYVTCCSLHNSQDVELPCLLIKKWVCKENVVHVHNRILFNYKEKCDHGILRKCAELDIVKGCKAGSQIYHSFSHVESKLKYVLIVRGHKNRKNTVRIKEDVKRGK